MSGVNVTVDDEDDIVQEFREARPEDEADAPAFSYRKVVPIFLEGKGDVRIYKHYWFRNLAERVEFKEAKDGPASHSGCNGVRQNVQNLREQGTIAYGIVDRDAHPTLEVRYQADDVAYRQANLDAASGIYYTLRWELENYLVDGRCWEEHRLDDAKSEQAQRPDQLGCVDIWRYFAKVNFKKSC